MAARGFDLSPRQISAAARLASYRAEQIRLKEGAARRRAEAAERTSAERPADAR